MLYLGCIPGIFGHALINYLLKIMSPLMILVFTNLEPIFGTLIGYGFGFQDEPTVWTLIGGLLIIAANIMVTITEFRPAEAKVEEADESLLEPFMNEKED